MFKYLLQKFRKFRLWVFEEPTLDYGDLSPREIFNLLYRHFRALLTANNNALEVMAAMEQTMQSGQPFGMATVRGHCTALSVNVFKMIQALRGIAPRRYDHLLPVFREISRRIEQELQRHPPVAEGEYILPISEIDRRHIDLVGEKMANIGEIGRRVGLRVPPGFVLTASAARHFIDSNRLQDEINRRLKTLDHENLEELYRVSNGIQQLIIKAEFPDDLAADLTAAYRRLARESGRRELLVSMRSSAVGEDRQSVSFAGQYRTQLNVGEEFLPQAYKEIVASKYKSEAIVYRLRRGYRHQDVNMGVGCMAMVEAEISGVLYTRAPDNHDSEWMVVNVARGLASQVVEGSTEIHTIMISCSEPHQPLTEPAPAAFNPAEGAELALSLLDLRQLQELGQAARRLEQHFGVPQDIEWSFDHKGELYILQSRPLRHPEPETAGRETTDAKEHPAVGTAGEQDRDLLLAGGVTASRGVAWGETFVVRNNVDLLRFPRDAVLVVVHPLPEWATLLDRAVAVISEGGQVAAHLATVAREFGVPAIFGLEGAAASLPNGTELTVDATRRRVYRGRREDLLEQAPPPNLMADSPVYQVMQRVLELVTPLNLTDPESAFFRPSSCRTMHDITRYCHERAVAEMFAFGTRLGYDDKSAKQLVGEMPSQWWVIDLEDGFHREYDRHLQYVTIDDIVSRPMLAIWQGMTAVPWQGPPPVNMRGFGSILLQSTMNPNLEPAVRSSLTTRNYFLVSQKFCNLSVRLGYHFALVEAHLGEFLTENYVSFQFKGGAADEARRLIRVQLLSEVLERFDFRVEQKMDALTARIERKPEDYLAVRLKILGYLLIHTRQIDMVMAEVAMVNKYRRRIMADLEDIMAGKL